MTERERQRLLKSQLQYLKSKNIKLPKIKEAIKNIEKRITNWFINAYYEKPYRQTFDQRLQGQ